MSKETAVRAAARDLHAAIEAATGAGYRVEWPASAAGLPGIGISATAAVEVPVVGSDRAVAVRVPATKAPPRPPKPSEPFTS